MPSNVHRPDPAADLTHSIFNAYNQAGPPERAGLTHDGKPVPPLDRVGAVVRHKWRSAACAGARAGADVALRLIESGLPADVVRARILEIYPAPIWPEAGGGSSGQSPAPTPGPNAPAEPT